MELLNRCIQGFVRLNPVPSGFSYGLLGGSSCNHHFLPLKVNETCVDDDCQQCGALDPHLNLVAVLVSCFAGIILTLVGWYRLNFHLDKYWISLLLLVSGLLLFGYGFTLFLKSKQSHS